jgi:drug/metabolite transporter (DMT)-like permease
LSLQAKLCITGRARDQCGPRQGDPLGPNLLNHQASTGMAVPILVMLVTPLFFATNVVLGRGVIDEVAPFTLAFLRWAAVALVLMPILLRDRHDVARAMSERPGLIALLALLGMGICGAGVYAALGHTTATNGNLIYTTSPVLIILIEAVFAGRRIGARELAGSLVAFLGVAVIILRGDPGALLALDLNIGDLMFLAAAVAWAVYSILYRSPSLSGLPNLSLFAVVALVGALQLLPFAIWEVATVAPLPATGHAWASIAGIVFFASLLSFSGYQYGVRALGASLAGVFMYLLPVYGAVLAVLLLGERFETHHFWGIMLVLGGVILATLPAAWFARAR